MPDQSFKDFVLDQLSGLPDVRAKAMFGGHGLYHGSYFFGILAEGRLYFKTDEASRPAYMSLGMGPFTYEQAGRKMTMHYFEVPPEVLEDRVELAEWAKRAAAIAAVKEPSRRRESRPPRSG